MPQFLAQMWKLLRLHRSMSFSALTFRLQLLLFLFLVILPLNIFIIFQKAVTSQDKEVCGNITTQITSKSCVLSADSCFISSFMPSKGGEKLVSYLRQPFNFLRLDSV